MQYFEAKPNHKRSAIVAHPVSMHNEHSIYGKATKIQKMIIAHNELKIHNFGDRDNIGNHEIE